MLEQAVDNTGVLNQPFVIAAIGVISTAVQVYLVGRHKVGRALRNWFRRRIEPVIGHMKSDNGLNRNYLKGSDGDQCDAECGRLQSEETTASPQVFGLESTRYHQAVPAYIPL